MFKQQKNGKISHEKILMDYFSTTKLIIYFEHVSNIATDVRVEHDYTNFCSSSRTVANPMFIKQLHLNH